MEQQKPKADFNVADKRELVDQEAVRESFINTLMRIHSLSEANATMIFERESSYFKKAVFENRDLKESTGISLVSAFLEIAINKLSIQPGYQSLARIALRSNKVNENNREVWVKTAYFEISAYGERDMRINSGQMKYMSNPIVIWQGDHFQPKTNDRGVLIVDYVPKIPREKIDVDGKKISVIVGAWCSITRMDGSLDFKWLLLDEIDRLEKYSTPKTSTNNPNPKANALYSSFEGGQIDPGFLETKCMKQDRKSVV